MWKILVLLVLPILGVSAGCAKTYYVKPGASVADFEVDKEDCQNNAAMASGYGTFQAEQQIANAMVYGANMVDQCLRQRGWRKATTQKWNNLEKADPKTLKCN